jgi:hypothetical protein
MRCTSEMKVSSVADCDYHVMIESFYVNLGAVIFRTGWATGACGANLCDKRVGGLGG